MIHLRLWEEINRMDLIDDIILAASILIFSLIVGIFLDKLLKRKLEEKVQASDSEIMEIFFRQFLCAW